MEFNQDSQVHRHKYRSNILQINSRTPRKISSSVAYILQEGKVLWSYKCENKFKEFIEENDKFFIQTKLRMDDRTVDFIFAGSLESLPPVSSKIVRIFTSSTFTGSKVPYLNEIFGFGDKLFFFFYSKIIHYISHHYQFQK